MTVQQQDSTAVCYSSWDTSCPWSPITCHPWNGSREEHYLPFPGLLSRCQPPRGADTGSRLTCHRQDTSEVCEGLILPAACAKIGGETQWRRKHLDVPQNLSLQAAFQEATCISMKSSGPYWFSPIGDKRKTRVEIVPSTCPGCLGILASSKCLISQSGWFLNWSHLQCPVWESIS